MGSPFICLYMVSLWVKYVVLCRRKLRAVSVNLLIGSFLSFISFSSTMVSTSLIFMLVYMSTMSTLPMVVSSDALKVFSFLVRLIVLRELNGSGGNKSVSSSLMNSANALPGESMVLVMILMGLPALWVFMFAYIVDIRCCFMFRICMILRFNSKGAYDSIGAIIISNALSISAVISVWFLSMTVIIPFSMFCLSFSVIL